MTETVSVNKNRLELAAPHAHWGLRAMFAAVFLFHGISKFPDLGVLSEMMGMPVAMLGLLAVMEIMVGGLILAGGTSVRGAENMTRVAGVLAAGIMAGAIALVHWGRWSFVASEEFPMGGMEFQLFLAVMGLYFAIRADRL